MDLNYSIKVKSKFRQHSRSRGEDYMVTASPGGIWLSTAFSQLSGPLLGHVLLRFLLLPSVLPEGSVSGFPPRFSRSLWPVSVHVPAKSLQLCLTLCNPMDCSPPGSSVSGFSRQEYWSGLPCPLPGDLPNPGIKPASLMSPELASGFFTTRATWEDLWSVSVP